MLKKGVKLKRFNAAEKLSDFSLVATAFFEALEDEDVEEALEILEGYLLTKRKASPSTVHQSLSRKVNPTLKTVAKLLHAAS